MHSSVSFFTLLTARDVRDLRLLFHPEWDQSPACHDHLALAVAGVDAYNRDLVSGSHVVAEGKIGLW